MSNTLPSTEFAREEAEEAVLDPRRRPATAYPVAGERRRAILGMTVAGRLLFVVATQRTGQIRVITARDATSRERQRYRRQKI